MGMRRTECWMAGKYLLPKLLLLISTDSLYLYCKNRIMGIETYLSLSAGLHGYCKRLCTIYLESRSYTAGSIFVVNK